MNAWDIADALLAARWLSRAKMRRVLMASDPADALYAGLYSIIGEATIDPKVAASVAFPSPHRPTSEAWAHILDYAVAPSRYNYAKIVRAARGGSDAAGTVIRLASLVLASGHRRRFVTVVKQVAHQSPALAADMREICHNLNQRGPGRLYARRRIVVSKR